MSAMQCWCRRCDEAASEQAMKVGGVLAAMAWVRMNLCPQCGNKRCPRATSHELACTGSNEPGQPGSDYGQPR